MELIFAVYFLLLVFFFLAVAIIFFSLCNLHDAKNHVVPYSEVVVLSLVQFGRAYSSFGSS